MFLFLKSLSRSVHHEEQQDQPDEQKYLKKIDNGMSLTVWRKSLVTSCNGFTVIDSQGNLVYRVDNYIGHPEELTLMDASGKSLLTMRRRKKLAMVDSWFVYEGDRDHENCRTTTTTKKRPVFCVKKHINILQSNSNVLAHVCNYHGRSSKRFAYTVEGSYMNRSCKVLDEWRRVVAEIRRKEAAKTGVSFGVDVFVLVVEPGFDPGFAMALVLLLDQMFS
ncbi:hypothetical protein QYF36_015622 [Acer negundo]|nr:hypothetical protein QYF36_015622 [Acer negundo]